MKVPKEIESLTTISAAGRRLNDVIVAAPEDGEIAGFVRLVAEALGAADALGAAKTSVAAKINAQGGIEDRPVDLSKAPSVIDELFFLHPRGKQRVGFFEDRLVVRTPKQDVEIMATDVEDVVVLDSIPKDKKNRVFILLNLREDAGITNGKTKIRACVIQVTGDQQLDIQHPKDASKRLSGIAAVVICQAIGSCGITGKATFHGSDARVFSSCDNAAAVEAYVKARSGFLFPLQNGLCFLESPAIFIHKDKIRSVDFSRANGASATFDFQVHLKTGAIEEFSNISRHELGCIQSWVEKVKLPVGFPETSDDSGDSGDSGDSDDRGNEASSSDDSDEEYDPYKKHAKRQKVASGEEGDGAKRAENGNPSDSDGDSDKSDDDCDVELVDEEDLKLSDLTKQFEIEEEVRRLDGEKMASRGGDGGSDDESDDKSFNEDESIEEDEDEDESSDGDCDVELVDEEDFKLADLQKHLGY